MLEKLGHQVVIAPDGISALNIPDLKTIELILMDLQMPGIDGYETTQRLRANGIDCPIIALTANTQEKRRCVDAGINDLMSKPL
ncbi:MAG: Sensor histidine kinase RcsC [Candidatus Celerinatantimonas neptuna]|nr:MAG: Sensor histidine kinase RcsC [Candidatus Celerinatantimonas neptuna]